MEKNGSILKGMYELIEKSSKYSRIKTLYEQKRVLFLEQPLSNLNAETDDRKDAVVFPLAGYMVLAVRGKHDELCLDCLIARLKANPPYPLTSNTIGNMMRLSASQQDLIFPAQPDFFNHLIVSLLDDSLGKFEKPSIVTLNISTADIYNVPLIARHGCKCRGEKSIAGSRRFVDKLIAELGECNGTI